MVTVGSKVPVRGETSGSTTLTESRPEELKDSVSK